MAVMDSAYAVRLNEDNYQAIASEKPDFDLDETRAWVERNGGGFFVRDATSKQYDCTYLTDGAFHQVYAFETFNSKDVFHKLMRL